MKVAMNKLRQIILYTLYTVSFHEFNVSLKHTQG